MDPFYTGSRTSVSHGQTLPPRHGTVKDQFPFSNTKSLTHNPQKSFTQIPPGTIPESREDGSLVTSNSFGVIPLGNGYNSGRGGGDGQTGAPSLCLAPRVRVRACVPGRVRAPPYYTTARWAQGGGTVDARGLCARGLASHNIGYGNPALVLSR